MASKLYGVGPNPKKFSHLTQSELKDLARRRAAAEQEKLSTEMAAQRRRGRR